MYAIGTSIVPGGYLSSIYYQMPNEKYPTWHPLRAFEFQGDAFLYRDSIGQRLSETQIRHLINNYDPNIRYKIDGSGANIRYIRKSVA